MCTKIHAIFDMCKMFDKNMFYHTRKYLCIK